MEAELIRNIDAGIPLILSNKTGLHFSNDNRFWYGDAYSKGNIETELVRRIFSEG